MLPNLRRVRVDSNPYGESAPGRDQGIRCGYTALLRKFQGYRVDDSARMRDERDALITTLVAVHDYGVKKGATLDIDLNVPHTDINVQSRRLDTPGVLETLRDCVEKCSLDGESLFTSTILARMHGLKVLSISSIKEHRQGHDNLLFGLSDVYFPMLACLELRDSSLEHSKLVKFLITHQKLYSTSI